MLGHGHLNENFVINDINELKNVTTSVFEY